MWIDSHCHVTADRFDEDRTEVLERAFEGGVETLISIGSGYGLAGNAQAIALAESDARIFAAVGVHPHEATELDDLQQGHGRLGCAAQEVLHAVLGEQGHPRSLGCCWHQEREAAVSCIPHLPS